MRITAKSESETRNHVIKRHQSVVVDRIDSLLDIMQFLGEHFVGIY